MTTPRLKLTPPRVSEKARQNGVVMMARLLGYTVLELGQKRRPVLCRACGAKNWPRFTDSTAGTPDLAVTHERWGGMWRFWEMKADDTPIRDGQADLLGRGLSVIIRSDREAAADLMATETRLGIAPNPRLKTFWDTAGEYVTSAQVQTVKEWPA